MCVCVRVCVWESVRDCERESGPKIRGGAGGTARGVGREGGKEGRKEGRKGFSVYSVCVVCVCVAVAFPDRGL